MRGHILLRQMVINYYIPYCTTTHSLSSMSGVGRGGKCEGGCVLGACLGWKWEGLGEKKRRGLKGRTDWDTVISQ